MEILRNPWRFNESKYFVGVRIQGVKSIWWKLNVQENVYRNKQEQNLEEEILPTF